MPKKQATPEQQTEIEETPHGAGHVTRWPAAAAIHQVARDARLAFMDSDGAIMAEDGEHWIPQTWHELCELLGSANLLLLTGPIELALGEWIEDARAETEALGKVSGRYVRWLWQRQTSRLSGVIVKMLLPSASGKRRRWQSRHIRCASSWAARTPSLALLRDIRHICDELGQPAAPSPGTLGASAMLAIWRDRDDAGRHSRPPLPLLASLIQHSPGGFKFTGDPAGVYEDAYELDRRNGYAAECRTLPAGTPHGPYQGPYASEIATRPALGAGALLGSHRCRSWFGRLTLEIMAPGIPLGDLPPFLIESPLDGSLIAPTAPGVYTSWCWQFEAEAITQRASEGAPLRILAANDLWCWPAETQELWPWQELMDQARAHFERRGEPHRAQLVKAAIVAGIGRLGMPYLDTDVLADDDGSDDGEPEEGTQLVISDLTPNLTWRLRSRFNDHGAPLHWHRYILARQNASILAAWHREWVAGRQPLAVNIDGLYTALPPVGGVAPADADTGDYRRRDCGGYFASPAAGVILTGRGGAKTPGVTPEQQQRIARAARRAWHGKRQDSRTAVSLEVGPVDQWAGHPNARIRTLEAIRRWYCDRRIAREVG